MTRLIKASNAIGNFSFKDSWGTPTFRYTRSENGKREEVAFSIGYIDEIQVISEEESRSLGKAAAGAIIGGILTGGIGLIAGAAFGGRSKRSAYFRVKFTNGDVIAFFEDNKALVKSLTEIAVIISMRSSV